MTRLFNLLRKTSLALVTATTALVLASIEANAQTILFEAGSTTIAEGIDGVTFDDGTGELLTVNLTFFPFPEFNFNDIYGLGVPPANVGPSGVPSSLILLPQAAADNLAVELQSIIAANSLQLPDNTIGGFNLPFADGLTETTVATRFGSIGGLNPSPATGGRDGSFGFSFDFVAVQEATAQEVPFHTDVLPGLVATGLIATGLKLKARAKAAKLNA